jgi:hypothetical protein
MADMTVTINGTLRLAQHACRGVFGEDASKGPVLPTPEPLLEVVGQWPAGKSDEALRLALHLPVDFDPAKVSLGRNHVMAVELVACRVTVLHLGKVVGHALRTDDAGLNAISLWFEMWEAWKRRLRQAH